MASRNHFVYQIFLFLICLTREHNHVLEHTLHQLLRQVHQRNMNPDHGGLSSAPVGIPKRRRQAGPQAADRRTLLQVF